MPNERADKVFILEDGVPKESYSSFSFDEELFGDELEMALHNLIEKAQEKIIPGTQIDPSSDDPPRFIVMSREMPVENWRLDFLLVDQYGKPTLLEAKLFQNPEARRKVIGQILDYASNAEKAWSEGRLRSKAERYWSEKGYDLEEVLSEFIMDEEFDLEVFWNEVESNLRNNNIRLIVAMEKFTGEARRIIEFLNKEMRNTEILGLEIRCYGANEEKLIVSPVIIGQTQATAEKKSTSVKTKWTYSLLKKAYDEMEDSVLKNRLLELLEWAKENNLLESTRSPKPSMGFIGELKGGRIFTIKGNGKILSLLSSKDFDHNEEERNKLSERLNELSIYDFDIDEVEKSRWSDRRLHEMDSKEYQEFKQILKDFCGQ